MDLPIKLNIPDSFYKEEEKCDYLITTEAKKVWAVELDLLNEFKRVCDQYQLQWFIAYGSLIGTIRHKGFIPWDNDIDVFMPRSDYDKLCKIAPSEFSGVYWWQTPITERGKYFQDFAKLRNSRTTCYAEDLMLQGINCGIYIDIFVLDDIPNNKKDITKIRKKTDFYLHFTRFLSPYNNNRKGIKQLKHLIWQGIYSLFLHNCKGDYMYTKVFDIYRSTQDKGYNMVGYLGEPCTFQKSWFSDVMWMPFEMIEVPVPVGYDHILRTLYGDYMQFPPIERRNTHEYFNMNADIPYKDYLVREREKESNLE